MMKANTEEIKLGNNNGIEDKMQLVIMYKYIKKSCSIRHLIKYSVLKSG